MVDQTSKWVIMAQASAIPLRSEIRTLWVIIAIARTRIAGRVTTHVLSIIMVPLFRFDPWELFRYS